LGIRWAHNGDSPIHPQTALRIVEFIKTGKDKQPVFLETTPKSETKTNLTNNKQFNKPDVSAQKVVVWNAQTEAKVRAIVNAGASVPKAMFKAAPKGFVAGLREARRKRHEKVDGNQTRLGKRVLLIKNEKFTSFKKPTETKKKKPSEISRIEQRAEELGIKPTDAMLRKYPGSYGSSKRF
jgi:hypothetical protein